MQNLIMLLTQKTSLNKNQITNILKLLDEGSSIPFIARYRKEMTGGATDDELRDFHEVYMSAKRLLDRKEEVVKLLTERGQISAELQKAIEHAQTMTELEDIYRPYKEKKIPVLLWRLKMVWSLWQIFYSQQSSIKKSLKVEQKVLLKVQSRVWMRR